MDRGFTKTIALEAATWERAIDEKGPAVRSAIEDALAGYEYVLDAATEATPLTEMWIRQLHSVICRSQETFRVYTTHGPQEQELPKGEYKKHPNSPTTSTGRIHHYAPVGEVISEMHRLVQELRSEPFLAAPPVVQAAYAHYAFVCIHPFADGNGRVSRALASIFLYRRPGVPLVILADQRGQYFDALESADAGDFRPFVNFTEQRTLDAIDLVEIQLLRRTDGSTEELASALRTALTGRGGLSVYDMDSNASRLLDLIAEKLNERFTALNLPHGVTLQTAQTYGSPLAPPEGYRESVHRPYLEATLAAYTPPTMRAALVVIVSAAGPPGPSADFVISASEGMRDQPIHLRDIYPSETQILQLKLDAWADAAIANLLQRVDQPDANDSSA